MFEPSYISLYKSGELEQRVATLKELLADCEICPRKCHVNRLENDSGFCRSGSLARISNYCDHHGEEPVLSGSKGSGTIFFSGCNMRCSYCQNYQISQAMDRKDSFLNGEELAEIMLYLQEKLQCHNINLVSPTHYVPQIVEAVFFAARGGLRLPIVYNTNAYDSTDTLKLLDGIVDIYLPDIKYSSDEWAIKFSQGKDYISQSRQAIGEMYRQVGNLVTDSSGMAQRGLIVRHLILPNGIAGSADSLRWLADHISRDVTVSVMAQYRPCYKADSEPLLSRGISLDEYQEVVALMEKLGLENGWLQEMDSFNYYLPDFERQGHPFQIK
ncbi:MAG: radical SAM protein [Dehalococcoidia bacterium]|jgi:putative pyruvate formate lyase activating enzyme